MNNKFKNKIIYIIAIIAICLTVMYDFLIGKNRVPYIQVDSNYIQCIFGSIATVGALGSTVLSIMLNVSDVTCLGFSFKEILRFSNTPINIKKMLFYSIGPIIPAMIFFILKYCSTMSLLLIWTVIYIIHCSKLTWVMMSEQTVLENLIMQHVQTIIQKGDLKSISENVTKWGIEIEQAIINNDHPLQDKYLKLLNLVHYSQKNNKKFNLKTKIEKVIINIFPIFVNSYGFAESYRKLLCNKNTPIYDDTSTIRNYMATIKYGNIQQIGILNIKEKIEDIIYELDADIEIIVFVLCQYFYAINSNTIISNELKYSTLKKYFSTLCRFSSAAKNSKAQSLALQYCFRDGVLYNKNDFNRSMIYEMFLDCLYRDNTFSDNLLYIQTIASIFRGAFFFLEFETETVREDYRAKIKKIIQGSLFTSDNINISMKSLILNHSNEILKFYIKDAIDNDYEKIFDYFPDGFGCKSTIWTLKSKIQFAFIFYLVKKINYNLFPIKEYLDNNSIKDRIKISICLSILELYDCKTELIEKNG